MSNPFKRGDRVVRLNDDHGILKVGSVGVVAYVGVRGVSIVGDYKSYLHQPKNLRAAIAGQDYDVPVAQPEANSGHLPDGSSVQKHSAGPLYPCVLAIRDKRLNGPAKYDYGVISPRNAEPLWFGNSETAAQVAALIKKDIEA